MVANELRSGMIAVNELKVKAPVNAWHGSHRGQKRSFADHSTSIDLLSPRSGSGYWSNTTHAYHEAMIL